MPPRHIFIVGEREETKDSKQQKISRKEGSDMLDLQYNDNDLAMKKKAFLVPVITSIISVIIISGCKKDKEPTVITNNITDISITKAIGGGEITDEGSSAISERGVCWSINPKPTISDSRTVDGKGGGTFSSLITGLSGGTGYYIRAYAENSAGTGYGQTEYFVSCDSSVATTKRATNIGSNTVTLNGAVSTEDNTVEVVFEYGTSVSYDHSVTAVMSSLKGTGNYNVSAGLSGLTDATTYHFRVRANGSKEIIYGQDMVFTTFLSDVDGNIYNTVLIGEQRWMQENLKTTKFSNGDEILTTTSPTMDITSAVKPEYQWLCSNNSYGRFYTYYTVTDERNVCPDGWHVPTDEDWTKLTDYLSNNGYGYKGNRSLIAKSLAAKSGWVSDTTSGNVGNDQSSNNSSGFNAFPSGGRLPVGELMFVNIHAIHWSTTEANPEAAYFRCIGYIPGAVFRGTFTKSYGLPVRCVQN